MKPEIAMRKQKGTMTMNESQYQKFTKKLFNRTWHMICFVLTAVCGVMAAYKPIWMLAEGCFMWLFDIYLKNYYPIEPDYDPEKQKASMIADNRLKKRALMAQLPCSRQLIMRAVFSERLPLLIIFAVSSLAAGIRMIFFGIDFDAGFYIMAIIPLAIQIIGISESYAFLDGKFAGYNILDGGFPAITMCFFIGGLEIFSRYEPMHTNTGAGVAMIIIAAITFAASVQSHRKAVRKAENTAYNGEKLMTDN
ncbi:MAG: hypothetical protein ACI4J5_09695 [Oscillospiraceae bacterium]